MIHSTFSDNSASAYGGGIPNTGTATLKNTIIAYSLSGGDCVDSVSGERLHNLIQDPPWTCGLTHAVRPSMRGITRLVPPRP